MILIAQDDGRKRHVRSCDAILIIVFWTLLRLSFLTTRVTDFEGSEEVIRNNVFALTFVFIFFC